MWSFIAGSGVADGSQRRVEKGHRWPQQLTRAMSYKEGEDYNFQRIIIFAIRHKVEHYEVMSTSTLCIKDLADTSRFH